jgi:GNAT superfamily N-acetyltransferase
MPNSEGNSIIRITDSRYLDEIVALHTDAFRNVFSGQIGEIFLRYYYRSLFEKGMVFGKITDGRLSGFIAGIVDDSLLYDIKYYFWAAFGLLTHVCSPAVIRSLIRHFKRLRAFRDVVIKPELSSIAVRNDMRGRGIGTELIDILDNDFREKHVLSYKVYTDMLYSTGSQLYEKLGFELFREVDLFGLPFRLYIKDLKNR